MYLRLCAFFVDVFKNTHGSIMWPNPRQQSPLRVRQRVCDPRGAPTSNGRYRGMRRRGVRAVRWPRSGNEQATKKQQRNVVNITRPAMMTAVGGAGAEGGGKVQDDRASSAAGVRWAPG